MKPEIVTLNGMPFAIVPLADYKQLAASAEMLEEISIFDAAMARNEESFPDALVGRLLADENPIKVFREYRKLSQQALADKAGITRAYLAAIEGGKKQGSVSVLKALAQALGVELDDIV